MKKSLCFILVLHSIIAFAQVPPVINPIKGFPQGLHKAREGELDPAQPIMLDGISIPIFTEKFEPMDGQSAMQTLMSGENVPEPWLDEKNQIKAFVFRSATPEEKRMMMQMQTGPEEPRSEWLYKPAPSFNFKDMNGTGSSLEQLKGKIVLLNFWFVECKPCIMEMPHLNELKAAYSGKPVEFIAVARNKEDQIREFLKKTEFSFRIVPAGTKTIQTYQVQGFPTNIIIDTAGVVRYVSLGFNPGLRDLLGNEIDKLLDPAEK